MKAEIIAVGTELLIGQIVNTNAQYLSKKMQEIGVDVYFHVVVGDNPERMRQVFELARSRSELILITGGLGPTQDDITKEMVAQVIGKKLVVDEPAMSRIRNFFARRNVVMTENNRRQALVIEGSTVFPNRNGLAPGMAVQGGNSWFVLLPGPPRELIPMVESEVMPFLQELLPEKGIIFSRLLRFYGIGEAQLAHEIQDLVAAQSNPTIAPYAGDREVSLRITAKAATRQEAEEMLKPLADELYRRFGRYIYGEGEAPLEQHLVELLQARKETLAVAESCSGGRLSQLITSVPGSSAVFMGGVVAYTPLAKRDLLQIDPQLIEKGTVTQEVAEAMATQVRRLHQSTYGIAITGVAGPEPIEGQSVGTVWLAWADGQNTYSQELRFPGERGEIANRAAKRGLQQLLWHIRQREVQ